MKFLFLLEHLGFVLSGHRKLLLNVLLLDDDLFEADDGALELEGSLGVSLDCVVELVDTLVETPDLGGVVCM